MWAKIAYVVAAKYVRWPQRVECDMKEKEIHTIFSYSSYRRFDIE